MEGHAVSTQTGAYAELPGVKLWFIDTGGAGEPIILLHPNTGTSETWEPQIAGRFHLLGVAGGGFIAMDYAAWRPERLRSLIVLTK
jgi:pimeloyl-ACP methyl ester carboxylesterase